jgi:hypothetical protein
MTVSLLYPKNQRELNNACCSFPLVKVYYEFVNLYLDEIIMTVRYMHE